MKASFSNFPSVDLVTRTIIKEMNAFEMLQAEQDLILLKEFSLSFDRVDFGSQLCEDTCLVCAGRPDL